jgi:hypothetical protein
MEQTFLNDDDKKSVTLSDNDKKSPKSRMRQNQPQPQHALLVPSHNNNTLTRVSIPPSNININITDTNGATIDWLDHHQELLASGGRPLASSTPLVLMQHGDSESGFNTTLDIDNGIESNNNNTTPLLLLELHPNDNDNEDWQPLTTHVLNYIRTKFRGSPPEQDSGTATTTTNHSSSLVISRRNSNYSRNSNNSSSPPREQQQQQQSNNNNTSWTMMTVLQLLATGAVLMVAGMALIQHEIQCANSNHPHNDTTTRTVFPQVQRLNQMLTCASHISNVSNNINVLDHPESPQAAAIYWSLIGAGRQFKLSVDEKTTIFLGW